METRINDKRRTEACAQGNSTRARLTSFGTITSTSGDPDANHRLIGVLVFVLDGILHDRGAASLEASSHSGRLSYFNDLGILLTGLSPRCRCPVDPASRLGL